MSGSAWALVILLAVGVLALAAVLVGLWVNHRRDRGRGSHARRRGDRP